MLKIGNVHIVKIYELESCMEYAVLGLDTLKIFNLTVISNKNEIWQNRTKLLRIFFLILDFTWFGIQICGK